jgi:hypothetical protein
MSELDSILRLVLYILALIGSVAYIERRLTRIEEKVNYLWQRAMKDNEPPPLFRSARD